MREKEWRELDSEATVLILSTCEDSEGASSMEEDNVAITGSSTSDVSPTPHKRSSKNVLI